MADNKMWQKCHNYGTAPPCVGLGDVSRVQNAAEAMVLSIVQLSVLNNKM